MKILVLGGTGAMGIHLVNILSQNKENKVYVTSRKARKSKENILYITGNARDEGFIKNILRENFDSIVDFMIYNTEEFKNRVDLLLSNCKQYVFLSSARIYADSEKPITENSQRLLDVVKDNVYLKTDEYALAKARQENLLFKTEKKNFTIVRPYITYAENRLQLGILEKEYWLSRALKGKTVLFCEDIFNKKTTLTYGFDVAKGISVLTGNENAIGEAFNIVQSKSLTWNEVWNIYKPIIEDCTKKEAKIKLVDLSRFERIYKSKYQIEYDRLYNRVFDTTKISKFIDISDFYSVEQGLKESLTNFIKNQNFLFSLYGLEGTIDRITNEIEFPWEIKNLKNLLKYYARRIGV